MVYFAEIAVQFIHEYGDISEDMGDCFTGRQRLDGPNQRARQGDSAYGNPGKQRSAAAAAGSFTQ